MFNISYNLNKKINAHVFFADESYNLLSNSSEILSKNLKNVSLFKEEFLAAGKVSINIFDRGIKHQVYIFKTKHNSLDYDYQKLGGNVLDVISKFENVNLFLESSNLIKKNFNFFVKNFFLGFFSKSYEFSNFKIKKIVIKN